MSEGKKPQCVRRGGFPIPGRAEVSAVMDVGNTSISAGWWVKGRLKRLTGIATRECLNETPSWCRWVDCFLNGQTGPFSLWLCSVVPQAVLPIEKACRRHKKPCVVVGRMVKVPIKNRYRKPQQVGQDRLVGAYATLRQTQPPVIIVDVGTAMTLDVVGPQGAYEGGVILPGIMMAAAALNEKTALLPLVSLKRPRALIGKDTQGSILSGLYYGYAALIKGLLNEVSKKLKRRAHTVLTGGFSYYLYPLLKKDFDHHEPHLVLKGLGHMADCCQ